MDTFFLNEEKINKVTMQNMKSLGRIFFLTFKGFYFESVCKAISDRYVLFLCSIERERKL